MPFVEKVFESDGDLNPGLINHILSIYTTHTKDCNHSFNIALSGGSVLHTLTDPLFISNPNVQYTNWNIYFADERCVDIDDPESNIGTAKRMWKDTSIIKAKWIDIKEFDESLLPDKMDVTILGMGPDGHTASLFPSKESFLKSLGNTCKLIKVNDSPKPPTSRVSMTINYLNFSSNVVFVVKGKEKGAVFQRVKAGDMNLPASHIHNAIWFVTKEVVESPQS